MTGPATAATVSWAGMAANLVPVIAGNLLGGTAQARHVMRPT
jgi:formate/nitrite transporter FocA (FNT family)